MALNLDWVAPEHQERAQALIPHLTQACEKAEKSARFLAMQYNRHAEWRGWPTEVAEDWIARRPVALLNYLAGDTGPDSVSRALLARLQDVYRPPTGKGMGRPPRVGVPGLNVPEDISKALDTVAWQVLRKFGGAIDQASFVQAAKVAANEDSDDEKAAQVRSVGTVKDKARKARYASIRGDLYWGDIRNSLELFIRARPELVDAFTEWDTNGRPRAWEPGGEWYAKGPGDRREANPLLRIKAGAYRRASQMVTEWKREGHLSYDGLEPDTDFDIWDVDENNPQVRAVGKIAKPVPERRQHKDSYYAWGLRDSVDCYHFPVTTTTKETT